MKPSHALCTIATLLTSGCVEQVPFALIAPEGTGTWFATHQVKSFIEEGNARFGAAVALTDRHLYAGASSSDQCGPMDGPLDDCQNKGVLTAWGRPLRRADLPAVLTSTAADIVGLGTDIAATPAQVWVGAPGGGTPPLPGRVFLFRRIRQRWSDPVELRLPADRAPVRDFGRRVALAPPWGAVFSPNEACDDGSGDRGVVHVYSEATGAWVHFETLCTPLAKDRDGTLVTGAVGDILIDGNQLFVGLAVSRDSDAGGANVGRVQIFRLDSDAVRFEQEIGPGVEAASTPDDFGASLAAEAGRLYVGAPGEGAVYIFVLRDDGWAQIRRLSEEDGRRRRFGESIAISEGQLLVGAPKDQNCATGVDPVAWSEECRSQGAAFLYVSDSQLELRLRHYLKVPLEDGGGGFGASVSISKATLAVGAPFDPLEGVGVDPDPSPGQKLYGAVYVYERDDNL